MPGRKKRERSKDDFYRTPEANTERFLGAWVPVAQPFRRILEPAAGDGAMLAPLARRWPGAQIDAFDINPRIVGIQQAPFFMQAPGTYDLIITNPPFTKAMEFVQYGLASLAPGGYLVLLLRLAFMATKRRLNYFREGQMPGDAYVEPERIKFITDPGASGDWSDHAWYVWRAGDRPRSIRVHILGIDADEESAAVDAERG